MLETIKALVSLFGITLLFGTTWVFAVFTFTSTNKNVSFVLQLLFAVTNTLQGFFIFIFLVVLNSDARQAWQKLFCPSKKKKPQSIASTSNKLPAIIPRSSAGTLSSTLPSFQSATLEKNTQKYNHESDELLSFSNPATMEEDKVESFPDLTKPPLESTTAEGPPKLHNEESEEVRVTIKSGRVIHGRRNRRSTRSHNHDIEIVEKDFGWSSTESLDDGDNWILGTSKGCLCSQHNDSFEWSLCIAIC